MDSTVIGSVGAGQGANDSPLASDLSWPSDGFRDVKIGLQVVSVLKCLFTRAELEALNEAAHGGAELPLSFVGGRSGSLRASLVHPDPYLLPASRHHAEY